jgi:hypothetical protein
MEMPAIFQSAPSEVPSRSLVSNPITSGGSDYTSREAEFLKYVEAYRSKTGRRDLTTVEIVRLYEHWIVGGD